MNTKQLTAVLRMDPYSHPYFQGVFPSDRLPARLQHYPAALVMNVDPHGRRGSHWCSIFIAQDRVGTFFDSYGHAPGYYTPLFQEFLERTCTTWTYSTSRLQSLDSDVCGQYCLYFLLLRSRNIPTQTIVRRFSSNTRKNDRYVYHFIRKHYAHVLKNPKYYVTHQVSRAMNKHK